VAHAGTPQHGVARQFPLVDWTATYASNLTVTVYRFLQLEDESTGTRRHRRCDRADTVFAGDGGFG
jgi:hypothetical protein